MQNFIGNQHRWGIDISITHSDSYALPILVALCQNQLVLAKLHGTHAGKITRHNEHVDFVFGRWRNPR